MTLAELQRAMNSKARVEIVKAKERAAFDYTLAELIGRSISRLYHSTNKMPKITDVYPNLFNKEELEAQERKRRNQQYALKLKAFVESHNKRLHEKEEQTLNG